MKIFLTGILSIFISLSVFAQKGIGISYTTKDSTIIDKCFENSPAAKAGLKAGDIILKINGSNIVGLDISYVSEKFKNSDAFVLDIKRGKQFLTINLKKDFTYTYNRKCLSGNCINGFGKALLNETNIICEGTFENGVINGTGKMYSSDGTLGYSGNISNNLPDGKGTTYFSSGKKESDGIFEKGYLINGTMYDRKGNVYMSGTFKNNKLISGTYCMKYEGNVAYLSCNDIRKIDSDNPVFNGTVTIRQNTPDGMLLSKGNYNNGNREGIFEEYDYANDMKMLIQYYNGSVSLSGRNHKAYSLDDGRLLADEIWFKDDVRDNFSKQIQMVHFVFNEGRSVGKMGTINTFKDLEHEYLYGNNSSSSYNNSSSYSNNTSSSKNEKEFLGMMTIIYSYNDNRSLLVKHYYDIYATVYVSKERLQEIAEYLADKNRPKYNSYEDYAFDTNTSTKSLDLDEESSEYIMDPYTIKQ